MSLFDTYAKRKHMLAQWNLLNQNGLIPWSVVPSPPTPVPSYGLFIGTERLPSINEESARHD